MVTSDGLSVAVGVTVDVNDSPASDMVIHDHTTVSSCAVGRVGVHDTTDDFDTDMDRYFTTDVPVNDNVSDIAVGGPMDPNHDWSTVDTDDGDNVNTVVLFSVSANLVRDGLASDPELH